MRADSWQHGIGRPYCKEGHHYCEHGDRTCCWRGGVEWSRRQPSSPWPQLHIALLTTLVSPKCFLVDEPTAEYKCQIVTTRVHSKADPLWWGIPNFCALWATLWAPFRTPHPWRRPLCWCWVQLEQWVARLFASCWSLGKTRLGRFCSALPRLPEQDNYWIYILYIIVYWCILEL